MAVIPMAHVDVFVADLSSQREVRRLAAEILTTSERLDVLINNVGGFWATRHVTVDGLEHTFAVNHLAPFLLTALLLERLEASGPPRVVTLSSAAHTQAGSISTTCKASANTPGHAPTTSRSSRTCSSRTSWPAA